MRLYASSPINNNMETFYCAGNISCNVDSLTEINAYFRFRFVTSLRTVTDSTQRTSAARIMYGSKAVEFIPAERV